MAFKRNKSKEKIIHNVQPEKVVIVTGPTFGSAMSFMLFGAVVGATAACIWQSKKGGLGLAAPGDDAILEGVTGGGAKDSSRADQLLDRLNTLSKRVKTLAGRAKETAQGAAEVVGPAISDAVTQAKTAAQEAEQRLQEDLKNPPPAPSAPSEDDDTETPDRNDPDVKIM